MEYSCGRSKNLLKAKDFGFEFQNAFLELGRVAALLRHMPWILPFTESLPEWLAVLISPSLGLVLQMRQVWPSQHLPFEINSYKQATNTKAPPFADNREGDYWDQGPVSVSQYGSFAFGNFS